MTTSETAHERREAVLERVLDFGIRVDAETILYALLIGLALFTRFYDLETRVMSHDESLHTYFSWKLERGEGFQHTPLMHGPLQFHLIAFSYFLFGDSDASARVPVAVAGVLAIGTILLYRRWLGRTGAIIAAALAIVSPYLLYYSRYVRNEALVVLIALLTVYAVFRYFEDRQPRWLYLLAAMLALHFTAKETSFIYAAQLMLFLGIYLSAQLLAQPWPRPQLKAAFSIGLVSSVIGTLVVILSLFRSSAAALLEQGETLEPLDPTAAVDAGTSLLTPVASIGILVTLAGLLLVAITLVMAFGRRLQSEFPALDLLVVSGTLTLPQLAAIPANMFGWNPIAYEDPTAISRTAIVLSTLIFLSGGIGLLWNWRRWLIASGIFIAIFAVFFTTLFTYSFGMFTGIVGSLGYWLEQHGVNRGSQPWYYYLLVQVPIYEFLPAIGALIAAFYGLRRLGMRRPASGTSSPAQPREFPYMLFLGYWALTALIAFSFAGERMPWLTVHITLPLILLSGWGIGAFLESMDWRLLRTSRTWIVVSLGALALLSLAQGVGYLLGQEPPFAGTELDQLRATMGFLSALLVGGVAVFGVGYLSRGWKMIDYARLSGLLFLAIMFALTVRSSFRAAYVNYDDATEYMVYAHSATGVKAVLAQVEDLSVRTTDSLAIDVGYDDDVSWPFSWYLRNFTGSHYYAANPSRELLNYPLVISGDNNWAKVEPILGNRYHSFEYIRMWWPMQDYFDLDGTRIWNAIRSPEYRSALWDIWLDRDYSAYGQLTGKDFSLQNWSPADRMRMYVRKDVAAQIWDYGVLPASFESVEFEDPYEDNFTELSAAVILGEGGEGGFEFSKPRDIAVGPDGNLFVSDAGNHRIVKISPEGQLLATWGQFNDVVQGNAPGGSFNEPWGLTVAPDGTIYVADTWNHRIQHFSADGEFLGMFGFFGQAESPTAFWGPRDVVVDQEGRIFVSDTGNKRIVVFDRDGQPLGSFGSVGVALGQLDETVGLSLGADGRIYVADTWNQRVQVFESSNGSDYQAVSEWPIDGWYGQSLENKPYLAAGPEGQICVSDPELYRVLCFDSGGEFLTGWGSFGVGPAQLGLPNGLSFDSEGGLWVADSANNRVMKFTPEFPAP